MPETERHKLSWLSLSIGLLEKNGIYIAANCYVLSVICYGESHILRRYGQALEFYGHILAKITERWVLKFFKYLT